MVDFSLAKLYMALCISYNKETSYIIKICQVWWLGQIFRFCDFLQQLIYYFVLKKSHNCVTEIMIFNINFSIVSFSNKGLKLLTRNIAVHREKQILHFSASPTTNYGHILSSGQNMWAEIMWLFITKLSLCSPGLFFFPIS
jgi:hypothetical protein